ncbi:hypothetical protein ACSBR1_018038 [Camellia fascicularis]
MASVPQSSWFYYTNTLSVRPTNTNTNTNTQANPSRNCTFKALKASSSSSNAESSPPKPKPKPNSSYSPEKSSQAEPSKTHDPVKLAFAKATAYKKSNPTPNVIIVQNQNPLSLSESDETGITNELACNEMEKENEKNIEIIAGSSSGIADKSEALFSEVTIGGNQEVPASVKLGMEKAKEYLKSKGVMESSKSVEESQTNSGLKGGNALFEKMVAKKEERKISSIDFMGLDFGEKKKSRGLPAGLVPVADSFPERDLCDVEILVGDTSNFGNATVSKPSSTEEDKSDIYKPKISTWGVFPRPSNISKTFGGGRVLRPGEVLETSEDKSLYYLWLLFRRGYDSEILTLKEDPCILQFRFFPFKCMLAPIIPFPLVTQHSLSTSRLNEYIVAPLCRRRRRRRNFVLCGKRCSASYDLKKTHSFI